MSTAIAVFNGPDIHGVIKFSKYNNNTILIYGKIYGLKPGLHGFHIHEFGDLSNGCASSGNHFDTNNSVHGGPESINHHTGDLGNILSINNPLTEIYIKNSEIALSGKNNIIGRTIVIHELPDDLGKGSNSESLINGNSGKRIACAIIGFSS
jgi:superoxide dismutase, Cu-Zn family